MLRWCFPLLESEFRHLDFHYHFDYYSSGMLLLVLVLVDVDVVMVIMMMMNVRCAMKDCLVMIVLFGDELC